MSRCFPFPPPGYEKETMNDEVDLLNKDKHKEKKHKKEKRDKDKEGKDKDKERSKDKKDKERSKDKDREKKERKEKHKEKKRSKDKQETDEKKIEGQPDGSNGRKHCENNLQADVVKDTKFGEICKKIADEERGGRDQMAEKHAAGDPKNEDGVAMLVEKYFDNRIEERENNKDKDAHDKRSDRQKLQDEGRVVGNTEVRSFIGAEQRRVVGNSEVRSFIGTEQRRVVGNTEVPSLIGAEQRRVGGTAKPMEKDTERKLEAKGKNKDQDGIDKQERDKEKKEKDKDKDKEKKDKDKNKDKDKDKGKRKHRDGEKKNKEKKATDKEKMKEKVNHEIKKQEKMIEAPKDHINTLSIKPIQIPKDSEKSVMEENLRKRKDCETNGFLHDNDVLPNKLPRPTLSSHPLTMNGRKPELCQPASPFASASTLPGRTLRFDNKVLKVNGLIQAQPTSISSTTSSIPPVKARENGEAPKKPPHPDSKYLSQILSVPKMDDWSDFDDQEWLFSSDSSQVKPKTVSSGVDGSPQVWDRALRIDSADVCALPYVIPY